MTTPLFYLNVLGVYDATTGLGTTYLAPAPGPLVGATKVGGGLGWLVNNRQTNKVFGIRFGLDHVVQIDTIPSTPESIHYEGGQAAFLVTSTLTSADNGHIYVASLPASVLHVGKILIFQSVSDPSPTVSNAWPVSGGFALGMDSIGTDIYMVDGTGAGLFVMHGDGPAITLVDASVGPTNADPIGSPDTTLATTVLGDVSNNGLWLLYPTHVSFWDAGVGSVTSVMSPPGANNMTAFCLDEAGANIYALDFVTSPVFGHVIWVFDAASKTYSRMIDISALPIDGRVIRVHNNTIWLLGGFSGHVFSVDATTGTPTDFDHSADFNSNEIANIVVSNGTLYLNEFKIHHRIDGQSSPSAFLDGTATIFTDPSVDFIAAGVQPNDSWYQFTDGNPDNIILSVTTHTLTLQEPAFSGGGPYTSSYWVNAPFEDVQAVADSSFTAILSVTNFLSLASSSIWMALDWSIDRMFLLDVGARRVDYYDTLLPSGGSIGSFDISAIDIGIPKIEVDPNNHHLWFSDGKYKLYSLDGQMGGPVNVYDVSSSITPDSTIVDFTINAYPTIQYVVVSDSAGGISSFLTSNGVFQGIVSYGTTMTLLNGQGSAGTAASPGYAGPSSGVWHGSPPPVNDPPSPFSLEGPNPIVYSVTSDGFGDALLAAVHDTNGSGVDQISVWSSASGSPPFTEQFTNAWPGTGFVGYLVPYTVVPGSVQMLVFGLDTLGNAFYMEPVGPYPAFPYTAGVDWVPNPLYTFPEVCLQIVPHDQFENLGTFLWALGTTKLYRLNLSSVTVDAIQDVRPGSMVGTSSLSAELSGDFLITESFIGNSFLNAGIDILFNLAHAFVGDSNSTAQLKESDSSSASIVTQSGLQVNQTATHYGAVADIHGFATVEAFLGTPPFTSRFEGEARNPASNPAEIKHTYVIKKPRGA